MILFTGKPSEDRQIAAHWAWVKLQCPDTLVLDTETTGLKGDAEIVQIAVMNLAGDVLLDTYVKPRKPIPPDAEAIHGISTKTVADAPPFEHMAVALRQVLDGRTCLIYNREYDLRLIRQSAMAADLDNMIALPSSAKFECAMLPYSAWVGEKSTYKASEYRWQKLPSGDHSALGDVRATRKLIYRMAGLEWLCD